MSKQSGRINRLNRSKRTSSNAGDISRAKAQRRKEKRLGNAAVLCVFAPLRETFYVKAVANYRSRIAILGGALLLLLTAVAISGSRDSAPVKPESSSQEPAPAVVSASPAKEYIYAGNRLLATEEPGATPTPALADNATFVSQNVPASMTAGQSYNLSITMQNTGTSTWNTTAYSLGAENPPNNLTWGNPVPVPNAVAPGGSAVFSFTVTAPSTPGTYNFQKQVRNGSQFFGARTQNVAVVVAAPSPDNAGFTSQNVPATMIAGQTYSVSVKLANTGTSTWTTTSYSLGTQNPQDNTIWGTTALPNGRIPLPKNTTPGNSVQFSFNVTAPATPGTYNFTRQMFNGSQFFGALTANVAVVVTGPAPTVPGNLRTTGVGSNNVNLAWNASSNNPGGYSLERSTNDNLHYQQIATPTQSATSYFDNSVSPGTGYFYRIKALGSGGSSSVYSNEVNATTNVAEPPNAPCCLNVVSFTTTTITITWAPNPNGPAPTGYRLEQSLNNVNFTQIADILATQTTFSVSGLTAGQNYWYRIRAYNTHPTPSPYSSPALAARTATGPPTTPTGLVVTSFTTNSISLDWQPSVNNTGYQVERSLDGVNFQFLANTTAVNPRHFDTGLQQVTTYWYRVRSFNGTVFSSYSNVVQQQTASPLVLAPPSNVVGTALNGSAIRLTFNDNSNNETGFEIQLSTNPASGFTPKAFTPANAGSTVTIDIDSGLSPETTYYCRVRALGNGTDVFSAWANSAGITTLGYYSLSLNGSNQFFQVNSHQTMDVVNSSFTVSAWVRTSIDYNNCGAAGCPAQTIVSRITPNGTGTNGGFEFWIAISGRPKFAIYRNWTKNSQVAVGHEVPALTPNSWHHLAAVFNYNSAVPANSTIAIYIDGVRRAIKPIGTSAFFPAGPSTSPLMVGRSTDPAGPAWFKGNIDEVHLAASALYTDESYISLGGWAHPEPRPTTTGLWKFDQRDGRDSSVNGNTGLTQSGAQYQAVYPHFIASTISPPHPLLLPSLRPQFVYELVRLVWQMVV